MPVFGKEQHLSNVRSVRHFCKTNDFAKDFYTVELHQYFDTFEQKIQEGKFSELKDVSLFKHAGIDSDELDLWFRLRGSVRDENIHQKMRNWMGPWAIGTETAHNILVLLCYKYNVSSGIRRASDIDFGHTWLCFIDQIQLLVQEIYNVVVFPRHLNMLVFKAEDFVSVGIGPLTHSDDFVQMGEPMDHLRGDMQKLACRMLVTCPPLESRTVKEFKIENEYFLKQPTATMAHFMIELAKIFKAEHDGVLVFPKLPTQIQASYQRWKQTHLVKVGLAKMKDVFEKLLHDLTLRKTPVANIKFVQEEIHAFPDPDSEGPGNLVPGAEGQAIACRTMHHYVPTLAAPLQTQPLQDTGWLVTEESAARSCFWAPLCKCDASMCQGFNRYACIRAGVAFDLPHSDAEWKGFMKKKAAITNARKRQRIAATRLKKKQSAKN
jgi:hypothetical protein